MADATPEKATAEKAAADRQNLPANPPAGSKGDAPAPVDFDAERIKVGTRYSERDDWVPSPFHQYGTVDTSDTAGVANNSVQDVSPVFAYAKVRNLETAARALDPKDPTPEELVVLPVGTVTVSGTAKTADAGRDDVHNALSALADEPFELGGPLPAEREAGRHAAVESE